MSTITTDESRDTKGSMKIIDATGDTKLEWSRTNQAEVENARRTFDELRGKGFLAYHTEGGAASTQVTEFDPNAELMLMTPPVVAG